MIEDITIEDISTNEQASDINENSKSHDTNMNVQESDTGKSSNKKHFSIADIRENAKTLPVKAEQAISDGKGNALIEIIQNMIKLSIGSIFSSCRAISLQQLLLSPKDKDKLVKIVYIISGIVFVLLVILCILFSNLELLFLAVEGILAAFIFDRILHTEARKSYKKIKKSNESDDYL